jgi:RNA polymerase sigma factor (sigma-70 family)
MAIRQLNGVIRQICGAVLDGQACSDGQLLERYLSRREEAAFEALVRRHGPMVLGVCQRILRNGHDAEDAFQATFLVLVRKAATIHPREQVGNWLYGVAYRTALKAKTMAAKQSARERIRPPQEHAMDEPCADWLPVLDQELSQLPDKYRVPIVLCDLEGKTRKNAARMLGWPEGTLSTRLTRARALLGQRLRWRGVTLSGGGIGLGLAGNAVSATLPPALVAGTVQAGTCFASGQIAVAGSVSARVLTLTEGVLKAMLLMKLKTPLAVGVALLILGLGIGAGVYQASLVAAHHGESEQSNEQKSKIQVIRNGPSKIAHGKTAPGEGWQPYGTTAEEAALGIYIDVDTSEAKFKSVPTYITSLSGDNCHWEMTGVSAIYPRLDPEKKPLPLESGFRIYLRYPPMDPDKLAVFQEAQKKWSVNWVAYGE